MKVSIVKTGRTTMGANRIGQILRPTHDIEFTKDSNANKFDAVVLHNRIDVRDNKKSIVYLCGGTTRKILDREDLRIKINNNPPAEIWTNSNQAAYLLKHRLPKIPCKCMYRPNALVIPKTCPPIPNNRRILWYWIDNNDPYMDEEMQRRIVKAFINMYDVEIHLISSFRTILYKFDGGFQHVKWRGKVDFRNDLPEAHGFVRVSKQLDFGRSTFQALAYGRWCIYLNMDEDNIFSVDKIKNIPGAVDSFIKYTTQDETEKRWLHIKENFNEKALNKYWCKELERVLST